jgi:hypothetical protein
LEAGIPAIDIRFQHHELILPVLGIFSSDEEFGNNVLDVCTQWLNSRPSEVIILSMMSIAFFATGAGLFKNSMYRDCVATGHATFIHSKRF